MRTVVVTGPMYHGFAARRRGRPLFLSAIAQHVKSGTPVREIVRMILTLAAIAAWSALILLVETS